MNYIAEIEGRVAGIPCVIAVTDYEEYTRGSFYEPPSGGFGDYVLLDRKGYRAKWLERKVDRRVERGIQEQIFNYFEE